MHQSQLAPADNKFHVGNRADGLHYWRTPGSTYDPLNAEFRFTFDPCPWPKPPGFDGLKSDWGHSNYVNPPFGSIMDWPVTGCQHEAIPKKRTCAKCGVVGKKLGPTAWINQAIAQKKAGRLSVLVYPVDKWVLKVLRDILGEHAHIRNLGDVKWLATEDGTQGKGTGRHIAAFIFKPAGWQPLPGALIPIHALAPAARAA